MPNIEPYYHIKFAPIVNGLSIDLPAWTFSCGAVDATDPAFVLISLPAGRISFIASELYQVGELYVVPELTMSTEFPQGSNYYLTMREFDPLKPYILANPPDDMLFSNGVLPPIIADIRIPNNSTVVHIAVRSADPGDPPDQRRDVVSKAGQIRAWRKGKQPEGWELLDAQKHKKAFPISLGRLESGEAWYILTPEAALDKTES